MVFPTSRWRRFLRATASVVAGEESVMRIKLAIATGIAAVILGTGTAAYAVVAQGWMNPTTTGNVLPIDDNHSPVSPVATTVTGTTTDDHGREPEPGDDRGGDRGGASTAATSRVATPSDDRGREPEPGDDRGGASAATTTPTGTLTAGDDHGHGRGGDDGAGHR